MPSNRKRDLGMHQEIFHDRILFVSCNSPCQRIFLRIDSRLGPDWWKRGRGSFDLFPSCHPRGNHLSPAFLSRGKSSFAKSELPLYRKWRISSMLATTFEPFPLLSISNHSSWRESLSPSLVKPFFEARTCLVLLTSLALPWAGASQLRNHISGPGRFGIFLFAGTNEDLRYRDPAHFWQHPKKKGLSFSLSWT